VNADPDPATQLNADPEKRIRNMVYIQQVRDKNRLVIILKMDKHREKFTVNSVIVERLLGEKTKHLQ
jgi:hypothetical protein